MLYWRLTRSPARHQVTSHLPPLLCPLRVPGPQSLVQQQGLQQLRTPLGSPPPPGDCEAPPDPGCPTLCHLLANLSADLLIDHAASTVLLPVPLDVVVLVATTHHTQEEHQEAY